MSSFKRLLLRLVLQAVALLAAALLAACAAPPKPANTDDTPTWSGRLSIKIDETNSQSAQSISAGFSLSGGPQRGDLALFTPLGGKAAQLTWQEGAAVLTTSDGKRTYPNVSTAVQMLTGADIPILELFGWLQGKQGVALEGISGWKADLTRHPEGRITASRIWPVPRIEIRMILEQ